MVAFLDSLQQELHTVLPNASLKLLTVPNCDTLQLYLIDPEYSLEGLDNDIAKRVMNNPLYWLFCWASGRVMARHILQHPSMVKGKVVMDVGAGSGVVAIAAAMAGAKKVIASDIDMLAQKAIALNAQVNRVEMEIIGDFNLYQGHVDVIMLADVLYDRNNMPLLEALVDRADIVYLADSRVKNFTHPCFIHRGKAEGETFPALGGFDEFFEVNIYDTSFDK
jgi:predicted nicotinamide N-methyase